MPETHQNKLPLGAGGGIPTFSGPVADLDGIPNVDESKLPGGDRPMAIKTYDRCVEALGDELDVDPMPETEALFEQISDLGAV